MVCFARESASYRKPFPPALLPSRSAAAKRSVAALQKCHGRGQLNPLPTGASMEPRFALPHADLFRVAAEVGRKVDDPWCSRLGAMHLLRLVEAAEDMEKDLVTVSAADLKVYARALGDTEKSAVRAG